MKRHLRTGQLGEELAAQHLESLGYRIVARNWRGRTGELDIVCEHGDWLVFVEVKTRSSARFGLPEDAVDARKLRRLRRVATEFMIREVGEQRLSRFDVVAVEAGPDGRSSVRHLVGVELPD